jgi:hypothetical protein
LFLRWYRAFEKYDFFLLKIIFFGVFESFWCVDLKNIFKQKFKKNYFDAFPSKNHFEKQSLPQYQTVSKLVKKCFSIHLFSFLLYFSPFCFQNFNFGLKFHIFLVHGLRRWERNSLENREEERKLLVDQFQQ